MNLANVRDDNGDSYIPASQRPDGTWRKARRVKEGYVPQEEVPLYESKGKQFLNRQVKTVDALPAGTVAHCTIPGLFIVEEKEKVKSKQKKKHAKNINKMEQLKITEPPNPKAKPPPEPVKTAKSEALSGNVPQEAVDPAKKLKNLKKRLREVEALEEKVKSGEIVKPDPDQLKKIDRKPDLLMQIRELEKKL